MGIPRARRILICRAFGLNLEHMPQRLPAFGGTRPLKVKVSSTLVAVTSRESATKPHMRHSADLPSNDESALPRELGSNRPRPRALQQDQQVAVDLLGIDHVRGPDAASSSSNTIEVTTCGPRWRPTNPPESSTATMVDTGRVLRRSQHMAAVCGSSTG
jgi:hypothetical protein